MIHLERIEAKNGRPTLRAQLPDGRRVYLHSPYDPVREAEQWAERLQDAKNSLVVLYGLGLGYPLQALLRRLESGTKVVVVEPHEELRHLSTIQRAQAEVPGFPHIFLAREWEDFKEVYKAHGNSWENIFFACSPSYPQVFAQDYAAFGEGLSGEMKSLRSNLATILYFSNIWQTNFLKNLRYAGGSSTIAPTFGAFAGKPAIIVSAGPSLNKNIDLLHRAKDKALILAVGTSTRLLLKKGIRPDLVATFDGGDTNYNVVFKDLPLEDIPLVYDPVCNYRILEHHRGPRVMMSVHPHNAWLNHYFDDPIGIVKVGGSIANTTFDLAVRLGADPIIFVGQDLAYTDDQLHASGTIEEIEVIGAKAKALEESNGKTSGHKKSENRIVWVEGIDGKPVATNVQMETFIHWFQEEFRLLQGHRTIIDATEGGALIRGSRIMKLDDALSGYCRTDIGGDLADFRGLLLGDPGFRRAEFEDYVKTVKRRIQELRPETHRGTQFAQRLVDHFAKGKSCPVNKLVGKLDRIDRKLKSGREEFSLLHYILDPVELIHRYAVDSGDASLDACRQSHQLYSGLERAFDFTMPLVDELLDALSDPGPDFSWPESLGRRPLASVGNP